MFSARDVQEKELKTEREKGREIGDSTQRGLEHVRPEHLIGLPALPSRVPYHPSSRKVITSGDS